MKAITIAEYGSPDVLRLTELPMPEPKAGEIRVKVHATTVKIGDLWARNFRAIAPKNFSMPFPLWLLARLSFGIWRPRRNTLGAEFSGEVEALGSGVSRFQLGDAVFGYRGPALGAYAQYICVPEDSIVAPKPRNMSFVEAATIPYGAVTAASLLSKVNVRQGHRVLIIGASGGIGAAAVQLAKGSGAKVTGVCGSGRVAMVKALGADRVIDYAKGDFAQQKGSYDLIFDVMRKSSFSRCQPLLTENGYYLLASFKLPQLLQMLTTSVRGGKRVVCALASETQADLFRIKELVEANQFTTVVDRCFTMHEVVAAHRYMESGERAGNVVVTVQHAD